MKIVRIYKPCIYIEVTETHNRTVLLNAEIEMNMLQFRKLEEAKQKKERIKLVWNKYDYFPEHWPAHVKTDYLLSFMGLVQELSYGGNEKSTLQMKSYKTTDFRIDMRGKA